MSAATAELKLRAENARDVMTANVFTISKGTTVRSAAKMLCDLSIGGAPVVDEHHRPIGVFSASDIVRHIARQPETDLLPPYYYHVSLQSHAVPGRMQVLGSEPEELVENIMMAVVMAVPEDASLTRVINLMLTESIHRVFVTNPDGQLVGVISAFDILSRLMA